LREEILKKKTTIGSNSLAQVRSDGDDRSPEATDQTDSKSVDSTKSAEEEDDEVLSRTFFMLINSWCLLLSLLKAS
jgi:hypothetical protein